MKRSKKGNAVYTQIGVWREPNGSIHLTLKGVKSGHVAVNADPSKPNGHPTLFARLDQLLKEAPPPLGEVTIRFVAGDGKVTGTQKIKLSPNSD
jgi:hypothetical protein